MRYLGIDIGIRTFSYAIVDGTVGNWKIRGWDVIDLGISLKCTKVRLAKAIHETLDKIPKIYEGVAIEMQPGKCRIMDYAEMAVISYFLSHGIIPKSAHSKEKYGKLFGLPCPSGKANYSVRKGMAVTYVSEVISGPALEFFNLHEKRDDLADSLCIALLFL